MDTIDKVIILLLTSVVILMPTAVIYSGMEWDDWLEEIEVMSCDELKDHFVKETLSPHQETKMQKMLIEQECI